MAENIETKKEEVVVEEKQGVKAWLKAKVEKIPSAVKYAGAAIAGGVVVVGGAVLGAVLADKFIEPEDPDFEDEGDSDFDDKPETEA